MKDLAPLAAELEVSERTLRRAVNEGTLRGERPTPRRLHLTAAEKQYIRHSWPLLGTLRQALRTESNVRFVLLFGSAARGHDTELSDIDLLVEMQDGSLAAQVDLALKLEAILGREVDVTMLEDALDNPLLLAEALQDGRVIVDREERWPKLRSRLGLLRGRAEIEVRKRKARALAGIDLLLAK